ncbi:hypothetical protein [Pseudomonas fluorescens]|uniref:hypothetical protein n=1 Tax=Pseudomonas fluorescens TaxID=294 RepID=UPI001780072D|nr:hypothetical protein [Pseudomonas fluorescens]
MASIQASTQYGQLQHTVDEQARINQALELSLRTTEAALALHLASAAITEPVAEPGKED